MTRSNELTGTLGAQTATDVPHGVMSSDYARQRREQAPVAFRLASRALEAVLAYHAFARRPAGEPIALLDFGAADGATLELVHTALGAHDSVGIEYSPELIAQAGDLSAGIRIVEGDVTSEHPEVEAGSRDLVLALAVLEHLEAPDRVFAQAYRALKPGGLFVATCPSGTWDDLSGFFGLHPDEHHEQAFDRRTFETHARDAGFTDTVYQRFMNAPIGFLPYLGLRVSPRFSRTIDVALRALRVFDFVFVNQLFVARKPAD